MKRLIEIGNYGKYSSSNYGSSRYVRIGNICFYFSYDEIVAFDDDRPEVLSALTTKGRLVCCGNIWGKTTGKHLNWIQPDKKKRLPYNKFTELLEEVLKRHNLIEK